MTPKKSFVGNICSKLMDLKKISIRNKIIIYITLFMLLAFFTLTTYVYSKMYDMLVENTYNTLSIVTGQNASNLNDVFNMINHTTVGLAATTEVGEWLKDKEYLNLNAPDFYMKKNKMSSDLRNYLLFNSAWKLKLISTVSIFVDDQYIDSIYIKPMPIETLKKYVMDAYDEINARGKYVNNLPPTIYNGTIYHARKLLNPHDSRKSVTFLVGTNERLIEDKYKELVYLEGITGYVIDKEGVIFSCTDKNYLGKTIAESIVKGKDYQHIKQVDVAGNQYMVAYKSIEDNDLTFVVSVPKNSIVAKTKESMRSYIIICMLIIGVLMIGGILITIKSTYFLKDLSLAINEIRKKNYEVKMPTYKNMALNNLSYTFNSMTGEIKFLIKDTYEKQLLLKDMQIRFLQYQMNPHFLFNVLLTIQMKAKFSKDESIYKMVNSLTALLRAGIYTEDNAKIKLKQELEYVEFYLYLQKVRFEDRLNYDIQISDENILAWHIPKLSVEPIVENAVIHGLEEKVGAGNVRINVYTIRDELFVEVHDDGIGFDTTKVREQFEDDRVVHEEGSLPKHTCVGINNTDKRIKLIYGDEYGLEIYSKPNEGTLIKIHIPMDLGR